MTEKEIAALGEQTMAMIRDMQDRHRREIEPLIKRMTDLNSLRSHPRWVADASQLPPLSPPERLG